jgi:hypothetical protein
VAEPPGHRVHRLPFRQQQRRVRVPQIVQPDQWHSLITESLRQRARSALILRDIPSGCSGRPSWSANTKGVMRQVYRLLALVRRYGPGPVDTACQRALDLDVLNVTKIASMLEKATENTPPPPHPAAAATARFARDPAEYRPAGTQLTLLPGRGADTAQPCGSWAGGGPAGHMAVFCNAAQGCRSV